jgi:hypothetical protein
VQATASSQLAAGHEVAGSQVSPRSTTPLPQVAVQSPSVLALQPAAQQRSPPTHCVMVWWLQLRLQLAVLPVDTSMVHALPSLQVLGQVVCGSQVSPGSTMRLPQLALHSLSVLALQPGAQQLSPETHCVMDWCVHVAVQLARLPDRLSMVQALPSLQEAAVGQVDTGSQVSPGSTTLLPQLALQSLSLTALQPGAQQPSPLRHWVMA